MKSSGLSKRKLIVYGMLIALLVVGNAVRWVNSDSVDVVRQQAVFGQSRHELLELQAAGDFNLRSGFQRDLFLKHTPVHQVVEVPIQVELAPKQPDPMDLLRERGNAFLDGVEVQGIMSTPDGPVAMVYSEGALSLLRNGEELIPGYTITEISNTELQVVNKLLNIQRLIVVGETNRE